MPRKKTLAPHVGLRTNWTTDGMSRGSYLSSTRTLSVARHCGNFVGSSKVNEGVVALFGGPVNADILTDQVSWRDQTVTIFGSFVGTLFRVLNCVECHIHSVRADLEALTLAIIPWHAADVIFCFRIVTFHYGLRPKITSVSLCQVCNKLQVRLPPYAHLNRRFSTSQVKIAAKPVKFVTTLQKVCPSVSSSILIPLCRSAPLNPFASVTNTLNLCKSAPALTFPLRMLQ